jgi:iron complex transport system ATP-binding protein
VEEILRLNPDVVLADSGAHKPLQETLESYNVTVVYIHGGSARSINEVCERLGLSDLVSRRLSELSAGELQRVVLAAALVKDPKVLLLDEPDGHLDVYSKTWLSSFLREISSRVTIVLSTHGPLFASMTCDYYVVLSRGRVVFTGFHDELLRDTSLLESVYNVSFTSISIGGLRVLLPFNQSAYRGKLVRQ